MHHLSASVHNVGEALLTLSKIKKKFEKDYIDMLEKLIALKIPV
ncbi:unnamed protein product, partial [Rotaria magnacalcarata]